MRREFAAKGRRIWVFSCRNENGPQAGSRLNCHKLTGLFFRDEAPWAEPEHQQKDQTHGQQTHMCRGIDQV